MRYLALILLGGWLVACTTTDGRIVSASQEQTPTEFSQLPGRYLQVGECGLFVWTAAEPHRFIAFSRSDTGKAEILYGHRIEQYLISKQTGTPTNEQFPVQDLVSGSGQKLVLKLAQPQTIDDGTRYRSGRLSSQTADGWQKVTPVIGLSVCMPQ
jgi:hypothetical protein